MKNRAKKILVVEDEIILRKAYCQILTHEGYEVTQASNGKEALAKLKESTPDVILLDILMPEMNGLDFLKTAKISDKYPNTKVIAFSNLSDQQKLQLMIKLGVTHNVLKSSLSPKELAETVKKLHA